MLHQEVVHETLTYSRAPALPDCDTLVRTHSSMVRRIAWQVHSRMSSAIALEDLMQIGLLSLVEAAKGCKRILIVDETRRSGGVAEALMALFAERTDVPLARITAEDSFIATGPAYAATMPSADGIYAAAIDLLGKAK